MKLPEALQNLFKQKPERKEMLLSLLLEVDYVQAALWAMGERGKSEIYATATVALVADTWEERTLACDRAIAKLGEEAIIAKLKKAVLGLPVTYLTASGDIEPGVRPEIRKLTQQLELTPIGFVPLPQAILHQLKVDEGVPPSVILLSVSEKTIHLALYKIGTLIGQKTLGKDNVASDIEATLKSFKELEVLPSRMLLWGGQPQHLAEVKHLLLKHPWPTRANFLHFPKIEILPPDSTIGAVCLAGASEMATTIGEAAEADERGQPKLTPGAAERVGLPAEEEAEAIIETEAEESPEAAIKPEKATIVEPEALGFRPNEDILEKQYQILPRGELGPKAGKYQKAEARKEEGEEEEEAGEGGSEETRRFAWPVKLSSFHPGHLLSILGWLPMPTARMPLVILTILGLASVSLWYWFLPQATVTIFEIPQTIEESTSLTINPTATVVDSESKTIPGRKQEKALSGEKTTAVTGKKQVGDPAKGGVVVYNKTTTGKTFKKSSVLVAGSLQFTLDDDVAIASASESIGSIIFGKANGGITAVAIGAQSNLPAASEFTFKDTLSSVAVARNDKPLTGGTSREVTVVTRADWEALVKALTDELVSQAKADLANSMGDGEKLIDETIRADVTEKSFGEELDQEAKELHGKLTLRVSGISYNDNDIITLMKNMVEGKVATGYALAPEQTSVKIEKAQVKKDGTIVVAVQFHGASVPSLDLESIKQKIAGKSIRAAQEYLRGVNGIGGVEFSLRWIPWKDRLPVNKGNISVTVAMPE